MNRISDLIYFEHEGQQYMARQLYSAKLWYFYTKDRYLFSWPDEIVRADTAEAAVENLIKAKEQNERMKKTK